MRRSTYLEFNKIRFSLLWFFCDLLWFFKDLVKIKNKRKIEKPLPPHPKTAQGGYLNGFVSLRRLNGRFYCPGRKSGFGSKLRKVKRTFSPLKLQPSKSNWAKISRGSGTNHAFLLSRHESIFFNWKDWKEEKKARIIFGEML